MKKSKDIFDESNEVQSNWWKANVPLEDKIAGTLIAKRKIKSMLPGKEDEMVWVYDLKADTGSYHVLDDKKKVIDEAITVQSGEFYSIGGKPQIDRQMQNIVVGQKVGFKFIDEIPSKTKGFAPSKNIKVYAPKNAAGDGPLMDEEFLAQQRLDDFDADGK